ncbi:MAG: DUF1801 domain-containing protein [Gordonia paraffinivorans]
MSDWREDTVDSIRTLILGVDDEIVEERKWKKPSNPDGVPTFSCDGLICTLETYKDKVKVTFVKGASLPDPANVFNASLDAGTRRAVDIKQTDTLNPNAFAAIVEAAIALNRS